MRWGYLLIVMCVAMGCRSQSTPLTNPFLAADRVPPPATGTLAPGTAQPYYAPAGAPPATTPGVAAPPATFSPAATPVTQPTYSAPPSTPPLQTAPVTPPGGWGQTPAGNPYGVQPTNGTVPLSDGTEVRINPDDYNLRFDGGSSGFAQTAASQQLVTQAPYVYSPPTVAQQNPGNVQPAQFAAATVPGTASDGFRPQGSGPRTTEPAVTRPVEQGIRTGPQPAENPQYFGFDATYRWLRGQLQYYPQSGYWGLRYIALNSAADAYGGVVVINNPEVLGDVQPGEFLLVQGFLETEDHFDGTFLPLYTIEGIQRQR